MEASRTQDAKQDLRSLLQTYPGLTTAKVRDAIVFAEAELNWICGNLIKAGLPE